MRTGISMQRCARCSRACFPKHLFCPHCHHNEFIPAPAQQGKIEELTEQHTDPPTRFASIRSDLGPVIVAAVYGKEVLLGSQIPLTSDFPGNNEGPIGYVPMPDHKDNR